VARIKNMKEKTGFLKGNKDTVVEINDDNFGYLIDIKESQKTGFFLYQHKNRKLCSQFSKNKNIIIVFSYTG
jgi:23S rRNA (cytosine1962-C5)-methyltransferase